MFHIYKKFAEYIPVGLLSLILLSDSDLEKHSLNVCCQFSITITSIVLFYIVVLRYEKSKLTAFLWAMFFCVIAVFLKNRFIFRKSF